MKDLSDSSLMPISPSLTNASARPLSITFAMGLLLIATIILQPIITYLNITHNINFKGPSYITAGFIYDIFFMVIAGGLIYQIAKGKNWARIIYFMIILLDSYLLANTLSDEFSRSMLLGVLNLSQLIVCIIAMSLIFSSAGVTYFKHSVIKNIATNSKLIVIKSILFFFVMQILLGSISVVSISTFEAIKLIPSNWYNDNIYYVNIGVIQIVLFIFYGFNMAQQPQGILNNKTIRILSACYMLLQVIFLLIVGNLHLQQITANGLLMLGAYYLVIQNAIKLGIFLKKRKQV